MKRAILFTIGVAIFAAPFLGATTPAIHGTYVEARTAEVFTGGCIMNSEAGTTGREALLAWKVDRGAFQGVALNDLSIVAAVSADVNLGIHEIGGDVAKAKTALFVDARATTSQRNALVAMAKQLAPDVVNSVVEVTPSRVEFSDDAKLIRVVAGPVRLAVEKVLNHDPTCGGKQWFHPLSSVSSAEMGTTDENSFIGASLGTKWSDPDKRSGFFGTFAY